jgi:hypothetical protein
VPEIWGDSPVQVSTLLTNGKFGRDGFLQPQFRIVHSNTEGATLDFPIRMNGIELQALAHPHCRPETKPSLVETMFQTLLPSEDEAWASRDSAQIQAAQKRHLERVEQARLDAAKPGVVDRCVTLAQHLCIYLGI